MDDFEPSQRILSFVILAYGMELIVMFEMVPPQAYPRYTVYVALAFAVSLCVGPLCGGTINEHTSWRWVFLLK